MAVGALVAALVQQGASTEEIGEVLKTSQGENDADESSNPNAETVDPTTKYAAEILAMHRVGKAGGKGGPPNGNGQGSRPPMTCWTCGKTGHRQANCWHPKRNATVSRSDQ